MTNASSAVMFPTATARASGQVQCAESTATEESVGSSSLLVTKQLSPILTTRSSQLYGVTSTISSSSSSSSYSPPYISSIPSPSSSSSSSSSSSRLFGSSSEEDWDDLDSSSAMSSPYTSEEEEEAAVTPRAKEYRIPELLFCPPAPRKPRICGSRICGGTTNNTAESFFAVPDLDHTFLTMREPASV